MKTIIIIKSIIALAAILMIVGVTIAIVVFVTLPEGEYVAIAEPHLEITSDNLNACIHNNLSMHENQSMIKANKLDISIPVTLSLRIIVIVLVLIVSIYIGVILEIVRKIIGDVEHNAPFNIKNIKRVKRIGFMVALAPVFEWFLHMIFSIWLSDYITIDEVKLVFDSGLGWPVFLLGLLIIVLGIAFEHGKRLQEENELTI